MNAPVHKSYSFQTNITLSDIAMIAIAVFVILGYFNGWGGH